MMTIKKILLAMLLLQGCTSPQQVSAPQQVPAPQQVSAPEFDVVVDLSPKAVKKLSETGEAIKVVAYFDGDGEKIPGIKTAPFRDVVLGSTAVEIEIGDIAHIENVFFKQDDFDRLYDKDYYVTLNVVSARRVNQNNILGCDVPIKKISEFVDRQTIVECKLLEEERLFKKK